MRIPVIQVSWKHLTNLFNIITAGSSNQDFLICCSDGRGTDLSGILSLNIMFQQKMGI